MATHVESCQASYDDEQFTQTDNLSTAKFDYRRRWKAKVHNGCYLRQTR